MKLKYASLIAAVALTACGSNKGKDAQPEEPAQTPAQSLIATLDSVANSGLFLFGHHDDTAYGHDWEYVEGNSDVKGVTGDYPGLMSWDLGMIELDSSKNLDGVPFEFMANEIAKQNARGGVNAISWHLRNPLDGGTSWDTEAEPLRQLDSLQSLSDTMDLWIGRAADFIGNLKDADGNRIPVIFRPWHENSGGWFWWGAPHGTPEQYIDLWKRTRRIFDEKGIDNVVWAYSPDKVPDRETYFRTYPGDEYVDILGTDIYHFGNEEGIAQYQEWISSQLPYVVEEAKKRGKIAAFTETGLEGLPLNNWYMDVLLPAIKDYPIAYVCVWRNAEKNSKAGHFYVPYPGHPAEADFKAFHDSGKPIFVK